MRRHDLLAEPFLILLNDSQRRKKIRNPLPFLAIRDWRIESTI